MLDRLMRTLTGSDAVVRASRGSDRQAFADLFIRSSILFLHLPPELEGGLDANLTLNGFPYFAIALSKAFAIFAWARAERGL
jgi:hypothetical protein